MFSGAPDRIRTCGLRLRRQKAGRVFVSFRGTIPTKLTDSYHKKVINETRDFAPTMPSRANTNTRVGGCKHVGSRPNLDPPGCRLRRRREPRSVRRHVVEPRRLEIAVS